MHHSSAFAVATALLAASLAIGAPSNYHSDSSDQAHGVTLPSRRVRESDFVESSASTLLNTTRALTNRDSSTNPLATGPVYSFQGYIFLCSVEIGTPPQTLDLLLDTGSSDTWVYASTTDPGLVGNRNIYRPEYSSSAVKQEGWSWKINYGSGNTASYASGDVYKDVVTIAGLSYEFQAVETLRSITGQIGQAQFSGILGLGFSKANQIRPGPQKTFTDNLFANGIQLKAFSIDLQVNSVGSIEIGSYNASKSDGNTASAPVITNPSGHWLITINGYRVGSFSVIAVSRNVILDTGTTLIYLSSDIVSYYYDQVQGAKKDPTYGAYTFDCQQNLPDFYIIIGAGYFQVPGFSLNSGTLSNGRCKGGIQVDPGLGFGILGNVFIKAVYVEFLLNSPATVMISGKLPE